MADDFSAETIKPLRVERKVLIVNLILLFICTQKMCFVSMGNDADHISCVLTLCEIGFIYLVIYVMFL